MEQSNLFRFFLILIHYHGRFVIQISTIELSNLLKFWHKLSIICQIFGKSMNNNLIYAEMIKVLW